ncbi:hypothetical protein LguiB_001320 [Lonicera macranthoides]
MAELSKIDLTMVNFEQTQNRTLFTQSKIDLTHQKLLTNQSSALFTRTKIDLTHPKLLTNQTSTLFARTGSYEAATTLVNYEEKIRDREGTNTSNASRKYNSKLCWCGLKELIFTEFGASPLFPLHFVGFTIAKMDKEFNMTLKDLAKNLLANLK